MNNNPIISKETIPGNTPDGHEVIRAIHQDNSLSYLRSGSSEEEIRTYPDSYLDVYHLMFTRFEALVDMMTGEDQTRLGFIYPGTNPRCQGTF